jgi:iron complex outermembrane receptor protein
LEGTVGFQFSTRDFEAIGEEAIVPPTTTDQAAVFAFEEVGPERLRVSLGARFESTDIDVEGPQDDRSFDTVSGSAGLVWKVADHYAIASFVASTRRPPVAEELYTNGAHPATAQFEVGDPNLGEESTMAYDIGLRKLDGRLSGEISLFLYDFGDYIFARPTGAVDGDSGFDVFEYEQADARFTGAEAHLDIELLHRDPHHLQLELLGDVVEAELTSNDEPLPFIPPAHVAIALAYQGPHLWGRVEGRHAAEQNDTSAFETSTDSYTMVNASVGYRFFGKGLVHDVMLRGNNLGDELARNHVSPLKDVAPLPGRDIGFVYRLTF